MEKLAEASIIGIYGNGIVGQAAQRFFSWCKKQYQYSYTVIIFDDNCPKSSLHDRVSFFTQCDLVLVSPGINPDLYSDYQDKTITELELFAHFFTKPTIAITGTVGKTTVTSLLGSCLERYAVGGNIGVGMLDLIPNQASYDGAILELSSYQLEHNHSFAPDYALLLNLYPNHLDRHKALDSYARAKCALFAHQAPHQKVYISRQVALSGECYDMLAQAKSRIVLVSDRPLSVAESRQLSFIEYDLIHSEDGIVCAQDRRGLITPIISQDIFSVDTFLDNWLFVCAVLYSKEHSAQKIASSKGSFEQRDHRMEYVATIEGVSFYNDSKATVMQATNAAIEKLALHKRPIMLILGGRTKGVDPQPWVSLWSKHPQVKRCFAFGEQWRCVVGVAWYKSLDLVMQAALQEACCGDQVLFSPSGESFDLYTNYKQRGASFKQMVYAYEAQQKPATSL